MSSNTLKLQNINKHYGKHKHALCDFSYEFTNGIYGLLGPNGAGKSTLMNVITDNLLPDKDGGQIFWNGVETRILKDKFRSQLGYMPQQQNLYENMTARTFLNYIAALKCLDKRSAEKEIVEIVERVELLDAIDKKMGGFSGGMKQRVLIAAALIGNPDLIILDEPTAGLDPASAAAMMALFVRYQAQSSDHTVILVTHDMDNVLNYCDHVVVLHEGSLIYTGDTPSFFNSNETMEQAAVLPPACIVMRNALIQQGFTIDVDQVYTEAALAKAIAKEVKR